MIQNTLENIASIMASKNSLQQAIHLSRIAWSKGEREPLRAWTVAC